MRCHTWSSGKVQDSSSLDHQCCAFVFVSLGKTLNLNLLVDHNASDTCHICGEYYNLNSDRACTWLVANHPRWGKMIVMISWWVNNIAISDLWKRHYTNADIIFSIIIIIVGEHQILSHTSILAHSWLYSSFNSLSSVSFFSLKTSRFICSCANLSLIRASFLVWNKQITKMINCYIS